MQHDGRLEQSCLRRTWCAAVRAVEQGGAREIAARQQLTVGFLPVTCHLTCPVTDFATRTSRMTKFVSQRFNDFPTVVETMKPEGWMPLS